MPYVDSAAAILQAWYSGNEVGNAIADVVFGKVNPSGKLPISLSRRIEDIGPAAFNIRSENGKIRYAEDLFVGYKNYTRTGVSPLFPFGSVVVLSFVVPPRALNGVTFLSGLACPTPPSPSQTSRFRHRSVKTPHRSPSNFRSTSQTRVRLRALKSFKLTSRFLQPPNSLSLVSSSRHSRRLRIFPPVRPRRRCWCSPSTAFRTGTTATTTG